MGVNLERKRGSSKVGQAASNAGYGLMVQGKGLYLTQQGLLTFNTDGNKVAMGQLPSNLAGETQRHTYGNRMASKLMEVLWEDL